MKASIRGYLLESLRVSSALQKTTHSYSILLYYTKSLEFEYLTIIIPLLCHIHDAVQTACSPSHVTAAHAETYAGVLAAFPHDFVSFTNDFCQVGTTTDFTH